MTPEPDGHWAVLIEKALSDHSYGASITLLEIGGHGEARSEFDAIVTGQRPDLLSVPDGARIIEFGPEQVGIVITHRIRSAELTRVSLARLRR